MLRRIVRYSPKSLSNFCSATTCIQNRNLHLTQTKNNDDKDSKFDPEHAFGRVKRCFKRDMREIKDTIFGRTHDYMGPDGVIDWDNPGAPIFSNHCDILIIGGGAVGSSIAYWLKRRAGDSLRVVVVEKDTSYRKASSALSVGGLRQQFSLEENIEMSLFAAEFLRNINRYLSVEGEDKVDVKFEPYGYLYLASEAGAETLQKNSNLQNSLGAKNVLLSAKRLKALFPWIETDGVEVGCLGLEKEGWFDPWALLYGFKRKALSLGAEFISAELKEFKFEQNTGCFVQGTDYFEYEKSHTVEVQTDDGKLRPITFAKCIIATGAFSGETAKLVRIGTGKDMLSVPLPVEPRKRCVYHFHAPDGPGLNTPLTIDPTGTYFRREGLANHYICGRSPDWNCEPSVDNLDVDYDYFENEVWPVLAKRCKAFENLKVKSAWAGYYDYNTFDENGIIGFHPYYDNILLATGFSGHGMQQAPAVGCAIAELIIDGRFISIDLTRLGFDRFITLEPMKELNII